MAKSPAETTRHYYDELGDDERHRLTKDVKGRVSFEVHRRFLARHVRPGQRVLEIGAGPGTFTTVLAALGARVVVTDLSPVQLELNERHLRDTPAEAAVERRLLLDVCDTSAFTDGEFDLVLAYGGPLSYAFEREVEATRGLLRVTRPGGVVVASVMSMLGAWRHSFAGVTELAEEQGEDANDRVLETGDLRHLDKPHACRLFRSHELRELAYAAGGTVVEASASNWASLADPESLARIERDPDRWSRFLDHETRACAEPGALDGGTHIVFALTVLP